MNSSSILDFHYNVGALAFIGLPELWYKTRIEGYQMNGVEKENGWVENKRRGIKREKYLVLELYSS